MDLVSFIQQMAHADSPGKMLPLLADAAVQHARADAVAVVEVEGSGDVRIVASRNLPEELSGWHADLEVVDAEIGRRLLGLTGGGFHDVRTIPMRGGASIFGALVLFFESPRSLSGSLMAFAEALATLGGATLERAFQYQQLERSYAELRSSRAALQRGEKLRALGEMAAGISHDLRNILNPLSLHLQVLKRAGARGAKIDLESVDEMRAVLDRGVQLLDGLRDFGRQAPDQRFEAVDLRKIIDEAIAIAKPRVASKRRNRSVAIHEEAGPAPRVMTVAAELVSAIVNLLVNAIDALEEGGDILVSSGASDCGGWIRVRDDGPGIPEEVQARIFEPYFTTKGSDGTGLGLAMVYAFVQRSGGRLDLDTRPGGGTTFTLWLPEAKV